MQFTDQSIGNPVYWAWNFGDGKTSTERNPVHLYSTAGTYSVTLYVKGQNCQGVISPIAKVTKSVVVTS
jgi:PKD repeat protein